MNVYLSDNRIIGTIDHAISGLRNVMQLFLNENRISGTIPRAIGVLHRLGTL